MNLDKRPALADLKPGDPWTFMFPTPREIDGEPVKIGDTIARWFNTAEPGRLFRVEAIHGATYETKFVGFQEIEAGQ